MKKQIISVLVLIALTAQLAGCSSNTEGEFSDSGSVSSNSSVSSDNIQSDVEEKKDESQNVISFEWLPLEELKNYPVIRKAANTALKINVSRSIEQSNNTLLNALRNKEFSEVQLNDGNVIDQITDGVYNTFTDIEASDEMAAFFNSYWYLLPDEAGEVAEFKGGQSLTRAQAMTLVMRAITPVESDRKPKQDASFTAVVGDTVYTDYASYLNSKAYLNTTNNTLTKSNFTDKMTRAEYIYLCLNSVFSGDEISAIEIGKADLSDCVQSTTATDLETAISNPDNGLPEALYNAVASANVLGIIGNETRWDEPITKTEAVDVFVATVKAYNAVEDYATNLSQAKENEALKERAKASYARVKDKVTINEAKYVEEFVKIAEQGLTDSEAEGILLLQYGKESTGGREVETSKPTTPSSSSSKPNTPSTPSSSSSKPTTPSSSSTPNTQEPEVSSIKSQPRPEAKIISEMQSGYSPFFDKIVSGYWIETELGKFWFSATSANGNCYRSMEDALAGKNKVSPSDVYPSERVEGIDWTQVKLH